MCTARIYRDLPDGKKFTHSYITYLWPDEDLDGDGEGDIDDAKMLAAMKIEEYIDVYLPPYFEWYTENIDVFTVPYDMDGADCDDVDPSSPTYGAPWGSLIQWKEAKSPDEAYVWFKLVDKDGIDHIGEPAVEYAEVFIAEHTGLPDSTGNYDRKKEHLRIPSIAIELKDFSIGDLNVTRFHIHSIGTIIPTGTGFGAYLEPETIKLYMKAIGEIEGERKITSQCILNDRGTGIGYTNYPSQDFMFHLDTKIVIGGLPLWVKIKLVWPHGEPFNWHQPYVTLPYKWEATSPVDLTPYFSYDPDSFSYLRFLWFENFEASNEIFL
jgi:hypothetical protein